MMNNDLVYRSDVEQMLAELGGCDASEEWERGWDEAIDVALSELREVKSVDRWIPCSERLPIFNFDVEVTTNDNEVLIGHYAGGCWYDSTNGNYIRVKAWKEPSEPWEGE